MIVSYCVLCSVDLVSVGKWALLAAVEREINTDLSLSCAVTILGQVLKETCLTSCVYSCFSHAGAPLRESWCMYMLYVYLKGQLQ